MNAKFLLLALSVAAFSSCSTVYKSGQTPDDVYFSPVRAEDNVKQNDTRREDNTTVYNETDASIRMSIRDRRWRDLDDYNYNNSPYNYCYCNCNNYHTGYYYNPFYYPAPIYTSAVKINNTPRMVNLNNYHGYNTNTAISSKTKTGSSNYNSGSRSGLGNTLRQVFSSRSNNNSNSSNNSSDRTYTPSSANSSGSSSSSSSSGSSTNTRPARGN